MFFQHSPIELHISIDVLDEVGIGGGASGVSGGLLHPYSPKGLHHFTTTYSIHFLAICLFSILIFG